MKALTTYQPWASLIACEAKLYETRSWGTDYRGPIANHAGAFYPSEKYQLENIGVNTCVAMMKELVKAQGIRKPFALDDLPRGCILSTGILTDCKQVKRTRLRDDGTAEILFTDGTLDRVPQRELLFGDFSPGRFAWRIRNVEMLPEPIPSKGRQRLWNWEAGVSRL